MILSLRMQAIIHTTYLIVKTVWLSDPDYCQSICFWRRSLGKQEQMYFSDKRNKLQSYFQVLLRSKTKNVLLTVREIYPKFIQHHQEKQFC